MIDVELTPQKPTQELVVDALAKARKLLRVELALARDEVGEDLDRSKRAAYAFVVALVTVSAGLALAVVALALAGVIGPLAVAIIAAVFVGVGVFAAVAGSRAIPDKPLAKTVERLQRDVQVVEEHAR